MAVEDVEKPKRARFAFEEDNNLEKSAEVSNKPQKKAKKKRTASLTGPGSFFISFGSYERLLYGLECKYENENIEINPVFSFPAHLSSIRSEAMTFKPTKSSVMKRNHVKYLLTGASDETIKVWDLRRKREVGILEGYQSGIISSIKYVEQRGMLLAASTDATIAMYRVRDWVFLRSLKGHIGRINSIDAHPDGRVAMSVGQDKMLRLWDLVAGKAVSALRLPSEGDVISWSPDGMYVSVICDCKLSIYNVDMTLAHRIVSKRRLHDIQYVFWKDKMYALVASEAGLTYIYEIPNAYKGSLNGDDDLYENWNEPFRKLDHVATLEGHKMRVKGIRALELDNGNMVVASISSDGLVNFYDFQKALHGSTKPVNSYDTDHSRLTCLSMGVLADG